MSTPDERKSVEIYTDGACSGNPGPGGWGAVLLYEGKVKEISGYDPATTNNRMEMLAAIRGLEALKAPCNVKLYSDSALLINGFLQNWLTKWQAKGWRTASGPVKNRDLWEMLLALTKIHKVTWIKVKGHAGDFYNERCDVLARTAIVDAQAKI
jgi:ribonuclease HI